MIKVGIDPGLSGCVAVLDCDDHCLELFDMPTTTTIVNNKTRRQIDMKEVHRQFMNWRLYYGVRELHIMVEALHAQQNNGSVGNFASGKNYGILLSVLTCCDLNYSLVSPQKWKKHCGLLGMTKDEGRLYAQTKWPDAPLNLKKHHDRADALFIATMIGHSSCPDKRNSALPRI